MKCLSVGMNPNYVLTEEEKKKRFDPKKTDKGRKGKRSLEHRDDSMDADPSGSPGNGLGMDLDFLMKNWESIFVLFLLESRNNDESTQEMRDERQFDQNILFAPSNSSSETPYAPTSVIASARGPIRGQYSGHVTSTDQSEASPVSSSRNSIIVR